MDETLRNTRKVLKNGGKLLFVETTALSAYQTITFGWWVGQDLERKDGPVLTENQWDILLRRTGFSGLDGIISDDDKGRATGSVMISTAIPDEPDSQPRATIIVEEGGEGPLATALATMHDGPNIGKVIITTVNHFNPELNPYCVLLTMDRGIWRRLSTLQFEALQRMLIHSKGILWVTRGAGTSNPDANMALGLARSVRSENAGVRLVTLDLDDQQRLSDVEAATVISRVYNYIFGSTHQRSGQDLEFSERKGVIQIPRALLDTAKNDFNRAEIFGAVPEPQPFAQKNRPLKMKLGTPGLLDSIHFRDEEALLLPIGDEDIEIDVEAAGLNFKDVMIGLGQLPYHDLGFECSGIVTKVGAKVENFIVGDRVCAMAYGAFANTVRTPYALASKVPDHLSFTAAASLPVVFCTALYSLSEIGRLATGDSILIHAAAGGVGQAAIMLAQNFGAEIFATVGSTEKRDFIMKTYDIPEDHIFSSRSTTFEQGVLRASKGRFVEIGKRDLVINNHLEMERFTQSVTFAAVDLGILAHRRPKSFQKLLADVIQMYGNNAIKAVSPINTYKMSELTSAMRSMQGGNHMGKVVIETDKEDIVQDALFENSNIDDWNKVVRPRVEGAWNIHHCFPQLDFFIMLASLSGVVGTPGQAAYAATNTFFDAFASYRISKGQAAATIDIGIVDDVGYVAESDEQRQAQINTLAQDHVQEQELLALIKAAIIHKSNNCDYQQTILGLKLYPNRKLPWWVSDTKFSHVVRSIQSVSTGEKKDIGTANLRRYLKEASSMAEVSRIICHALISKISNVSMTPAEDIEPEKPLVAYGLDSLVAVELRNWMVNELGANVPLLELMNSPSIMALADIIATNSTLVDQSSLKSST
ncbi:hypothetical protein P7C71_g4290, partial [Lecanoromycetidae sp. Uapishka_2]